jgi:hypothetical protein
MHLRIRVTQSCVPIPISQISKRQTTGTFHMLSV